MYAIQRGVGKRAQHDVLQRGHAAIGAINRQRRDHQRVRPQKRPEGHGRNPLELEGVKERTTGGETRPPKGDQGGLQEVGGFFHETFESAGRREEHLLQTRRKTNTLWASTVAKFQRLSGGVMVVGRKPVRNVPYGRPDSVILLPLSVRAG